MDMPSKPINTQFMEITYKVHVYHKFLKVIIIKVHHPPKQAIVKKKCMNLFWSLVRRDLVPKEVQWSTLYKHYTNVAIASHMKIWFVDVFSFSVRTYTNRPRTLRRLVTKSIHLGAKGYRRLSSKTRRLEVGAIPWYILYGLIPEGFISNWPECWYDLPLFDYFAIILL